jgi:hypothetical protein
MRESRRQCGKTWEQWLDIANAHEEDVDYAEADRMTVIVDRLRASRG